MIAWTASRLGRYRWMHRAVGAAKLYSLAGSVLGRRPMYRHFGGMIYRISSPDQFGIAAEIFGDGIYAAALEMQRIDAFIDLGCNAGWFAVWLAAQQPSSARVGLLIDAEERLVTEAHWHVTANKLDGLKVMSGAVGLPADVATAVFYVQQSASASSLLEYRPGKQPPAKGRIRTINVPALSVEFEWKRLFGDRPVDLLKIDIEGTELDFVRREANFLRRQVRSVICEWHKWQVELDQLGTALDAVGLSRRRISAENKWMGTALYVRQRSAA